MSTTPADPADRELSRLAELASLDVLPVTGPSPALQAIVAAAASACDVPIALVTLLDADTQYFKAQMGLDFGVADRKFSFCTHALGNEEILEVVDAREDERFAENPYVVGEPNIRFYAGAPLRTQNGHPLGTVCVIDRRPRKLDATQRLVLTSLAEATVAIFESERQARQERLWSQRVLDSIGDCVISTDAQGVVDYVNPAAASVLGLSQDTNYEKPVDELLQLSRFGAPVVNPISTTLTTGAAASIPIDTVLHIPGEPDVDIEDSATPIRDDKGELVGAVMVFRDVTAERETARQLEWFGTRDPLTGLLNRFSFEQAISERLDRVKDSGDISQAGVLLYCDLDRFKGVNDELGHAVGDQLLRQVATAMAKQVGAPAMFARIGGDEFGVLLQPMAADEAEQVGHALLQSLVELRQGFVDHRVNVGASFGMVMLDEIGLTMAESLRRADIACYAAKNAGGDQLRWYDRKAEDIEEWTSSLRWMNVIEQALHTSGLALYGQHILPMASDRPPSVEVLVRYEHAGETNTARAFMSAVERFLLGRRLDEWVVSQTLAWLRQEPSVLDRVDAVHINLSAQTVGDLSMVERFVRLILDSGLPPSKICFEITESSAVADFGSAVQFIDGLKDIGCRFALDDFGRGFASFEYLKRLPVDIVKIDGMFIADLATDEVSRHMVTSIQGVCDLLDVRTVAECIEDPAVLVDLANLGVSSTQGYYHHRPEPLDLSFGSLIL